MYCNIICVSVYFKVFKKYFIRYNVQHDFAMYTYQKNIVGQPTNRERYDHGDHHFYHL